MSDRAGDMQVTQFLYKLCRGQCIFTFENVDGDITNTPLVPRFGP